MAVTLTPNSASKSNLTEANSGSINRILTIFEKTIELDELSIPETVSKDTHTTESVLSIEIPLIKINDYIFNRDEIVNMNIDTTNFLPKITLSVNFLNQVFLSKEMPKDGDIISIAIRSRNDLLKIVRNDYVITGVHVMPNLTDFKSPVGMTFYGELFIPGLKSQKNDFSFLGTSYMALQDFAKKFNLGFASNESDTNDKQVWLKANIAGDIYVRDVINKSWKNAESFYDCWIDLYYNLNFVNINKQLLSIESEVDIGVSLTNIDKNWSHGAKTAPEYAVPIGKVFSNYPNYRTTSFYISSWRPINRSSDITFTIGTKTTCEMFEHNKNVYLNPKATKYWAIPIEPIYDKKKASAGILLRGRAAYVKDDKNKDLQRANYSYVDLYEKYPWLGIQYTVSNPDEDHLSWDGNHHKNYQRSRIHNLINLKELDKLNLHIQVDGNNMNVLKGEKVPVVLIKKDIVENAAMEANNNFKDIVDLFYSGWYYVKGFVINWSSSNKDSVISGFTQDFILTRREWPTPIPTENPNN